MSFSVSKQMPKRLARKIGHGEDEPVSLSESTTVLVVTDLYIMPYTDRSFVVMGETLDHSNALTLLGGKYNTNLRIGQGWIFAKVREESVRKYIESGEIIPYVYTEQDQAKYNQKKVDTKETVDLSKEFRNLFRELREAFDSDEDYEGKSIIEVIYQLEEKYLPRGVVSIKADTKEIPKTTPENQNLKRIVKNI
uniref:Uncharacterized protein n=1 Tax=Marseillevirus LCMAC201 TaxID=2506605 RepID=A0A481YYE4_9VIRU|nr:MAG: hypothetical protein LCMAC201_03960 [Marseillevirus LCMAC201]